MGTAEEKMTADEEPTQAISPGADPFEPKSAGQSDPMMVNPAAAAAAEFDPDHEPTPRLFVSWPPTPTPTPTPPPPSP